MRVIGASNIGAIISIIAKCHHPVAVGDKPSGGELNVAVITPEPASFVADIATGYIKCVCSNALKSVPGLAVSMIVAV
jgi:hypothetical protein